MENRVNAVNCVNLLYKIARCIYHNTEIGESVEPADFLNVRQHLNVYCRRHPGRKFKTKKGKIWRVS